jgi:hypothetical protein
MEFRRSKSMGLDAHVLFRGIDPEDCNIVTDCIVRKHLGNIAMIAFLREEIGKLPLAETSFPIILQRVIYNGIHGGDEIATGEVPLLKGELELLATIELEKDVQAFVRDMNDLCDASLLTENPIVF